MVTTLPIERIDSKVESNQINKRPQQPGMRYIRCPPQGHAPQLPGSSDTAGHVWLPGPGQI